MQEIIDNDDLFMNSYNEKCSHELTSYLIGIGAELKNVVIRASIM